jgi:T-complex protein 1 subunit alpha
MLIKVYVLTAPSQLSRFHDSSPMLRLPAWTSPCRRSREEMGVQLLLSDPDQLGKMRDRESDITKERINKILATGANVIPTTGGIDDLCLKYFLETGAMAVRRCKKQDLKRIAKATGASFFTSLLLLTLKERKVSRLAC